MILLKAVYGQILTVVGSLLALCFLNSLAMIITPLSTKYAFLIHLINQPLLEQWRMGLTSFTKKRFMIGQDGRRPLGSFLGMIVLSFIGLLFFFLSTIVFQASNSQLMQSDQGVPSLIDPTNIPSSSNSQTKYPLISDSYLGATLPNSDYQIKSSSLWTDNTAYSVASESQFNGNTSVFLNDLNWNRISGDNGFVTTASMSIDGISVESLSSTTPGTINIQVIDNGSPAVFDIPLVSSTLGQSYAFAIEGKYTLDYLHFDLVTFDAETFSSSDCMDKYYEFVSSHTLTNGTLILNNTYDYSNKNSYDKSNLESDIASAENEVKYSMISVQNQTKEDDIYQSYYLSKRSARRQDKIDTQNGTIDIIEYDYKVRIVRYSKLNLDSVYKVSYTSGSNSGGTSLPITPFFRTTNPDYLNMASLSHNRRLLSLYKYESYIDVLPTIILLGVLGGLTLILTCISYAYNFKRIRNKAYSVPLETLSYILYTPSTALFPIFQKVRRAKFCMVDGYDPATGYNHLGLVSHEDADHITRREPDVPYGKAYKPQKKQGNMLPNNYV